MNVNLERELKKILENHPTKLPEVVKNRIDQTLSSLPEKRRKSPARKIIFASTAAVVALGCVIGSPFVSPAIANTLKQIPIIESVFKIAGDYGLKTADEKNMTIEVNQSVTDKGITLNVSEVLYDGSRLSIGYLQESSKGIQEMKSMDMEFEINETPFHSAMSSRGSIINQQTYAGTLTLTPEKELPDQFRLKMTVMRIGNIEGKWQFTFPVKKMASDNKIIMPMMTKTEGAQSITVKKILFTPSSTELNVELRKPIQSEQIDFQLVDDKGIILQAFGSSGSANNDGQAEIWQLKANFAPVKELPKSILVRPIRHEMASTPLKEVHVAMDHSPTKDHPLVLSQGEAGRLEITQVEILADKTLVHYHVIGDNPFEQSNPLWIEDESGKKHILLDKKVEIDRPETYSFVREYPAFRPDQKLKFVTRELPSPKALNKLEMLIPINP
ncbi:DUF4179 domain-containing protein [Brevibacillus ginsengisoli]|uniref:DUF4179 domain-containing protein n=1 Tax=Brevibacillus ginsengisoli TaxID=363854 RepID=UPI003CF4188B